MNTKVWVITSKTRDEMETSVLCRYDDGFTGELLSETDRTIARSSEENFQERDGTTPPFRYDHRFVGGTWDGDINPGTGREFNTGREASELPSSNLPNIIISPQATRPSSPTAEEKQERRVLTHWPDNVALALDWHY